MQERERKQWLTALEIELMGIQARNAIKRLCTGGRWQKGHPGFGGARAKTVMLSSKLAATAEATATEPTSLRSGQPMVPAFVG